MQRPWVQPAEVKEYSESAKVAARSDVRLAYDIARAERYVIYHTHNRFDTEEYEKELPVEPPFCLNTAGAGRAHGGAVL